MHRISSNLSFKEKYFIIIIIRYFQCLLNIHFYNTFTDSFSRLNTLFNIIIALIITMMRECIAFSPTAYDEFVSLPSQSFGLSGHIVNFPYPYLFSLIWRVQCTQLDDIEIWMSFTNMLVWSTWWFRLGFFGESVIIDVEKCGNCARRVLKLHGRSLLEIILIITRSSITFWS